MLESVPAPIRTENDPEPTPPPVPARVPGTYTTCEFCECKVTRSGEVYSMSEKARGFRDTNESHRKEVAKLNEQIENLQREIATKQNELAALRSPSGTSRKSVSDALL
jgi:uncharacterized protein YlxW (UPF0749 family)